MIIILIEFVLFLTWMGTTVFIIMKYFRNYTKQPPNEVRTFVERVNEMRNIDHRLVHITKANILFIIIPMFGIIIIELFLR